MLPLATSKSKHKPPSSRWNLLSQLMVWGLVLELSGFAVKQVWGQFLGERAMTTGVSLPCHLEQTAIVIGADHPATINWQAMQLANPVCYACEPVALTCVNRLAQHPAQDRQLAAPRIADQHPWADRYPELFRLPLPSAAIQLEVRQNICRQGLTDCLVLVKTIESLPNPRR